MILKTLQIKQHSRNHPTDLKYCNFYMFIDLTKLHKQKASYITFYENLEANALKCSKGQLLQNFEKLLRKFQH